jgi:type IV secretion system protein VirB10
LKSEHAERGSLPEPPAAVLEVEHRGGTVRCTSTASGGAPESFHFTIDGKETRTKTGTKSLSTIAKWEGAALLINTMVSGPAGAYTQMDRWRVSRDGATLTIQREIVGRAGGAEAVLSYERQGLAPHPAGKPGEYAVEAGTKIPLVLINSVSTKQSSEGDRIYLSTTFPVLVNGQVIIPPGSYVAGTLTFVKRPGRIHGRGELYLRFDSLTLPNGTTRDFRSRVGALDALDKGELDRREGNIKSEGGKGTDARTIGQAGAAGASVGAIAGAAAGHPGMGMGVGAAAGAAAGVMGVLLSRGPDLVLARGSTLEMVLDRKLVFGEDELASNPRQKP